MHTIRLNNLTFLAHHGVCPEEQFIGGRYEVDVSMDLDFEAAGKGDDLQQTVDYALVYRLVEGVINGPRVQLLERLAWRIAQVVLQQFPPVCYIEVAVRKINPPLGGECSSAEVIFRGPRLTTKQKDH